jgi:hypothetical protein
MSNPRIDTPLALDNAIAANSLATHDALWRETRGAGAYRSDVIFGLVVVLALVSLFLGKSYPAMIAASAGLAAISGFAVRVSRQHKALCTLVERIERAAVKVV